MRGTNSIIARAALTATLVAGAGGTAHAQSAGQSGGTWSLPDPTETQNRSRAQGPVDSQNPVVRPTNAAPQPSTSEPPPATTSAPGAVPTIAVPPPRPVATRAPAPAPTTATTSAPLRAPAPTSDPTSRASAPTPAPASAPSETPTPDTTAGIATSAPSVTPPAQVQAPAPASEAPSAQGWPVWLWAAPIAALVLGALAFLLRRKRPEPEAEEYEAETAPVLPPKPRPEPAAKPAATVPQPAFAPPPEPASPSIAPAAETGPQIAFEPLGMRLSLVYATLRYRITVTADDALPAGHMLGDMTGAHGSIPPEQQLAPPPEALAALKPIPPLAAGESLTLTGEVQLPLNAIRPLQRGNASFFVPLLRLCALFGDDAAPVRRVFTLGTAGGDALAPLRLDTGPNEFRDLASREVAAARAYPLTAGERRVAAV